MRRVILLVLGLWVGVATSAYATETVSTDCPPADPTSIFGYIMGRCQIGLGQLAPGEAIDVRFVMPYPADPTFGGIVTSPRPWPVCVPGLIRGFRVSASPDLGSTAPPGVWVAVGSIVPGAIHLYIRNDSGQVAPSVFAGVSWQCGL